MLALVSKSVINSLVSYFQITYRKFKTFIYEFILMLIFK